MAVLFPGTSGNYFSLPTALNTNGATIFARMRLPSVPAADAVPLCVVSSSTSTKNNLGGSYGDGDQLHAFVIKPNGSTYDINEIAYWDGFLGPIVSGIAPGTWVDLAISLYEANGRPAVKFSIKPVGGSFVSRVRNDSFWGTYGFDTFANLKVLLGARHGGASPANMLALDCIMYASAITADADIEEQMDAIGAQFPSPYWVTSFRGYASAALAAAKESGSATPTAWTIVGEVGVDNGYDGGGAGPILTGSPTLSRFDSLAVSSTPSGLTIGDVRATTVELSWTAVAGATEYLIYGRKVDSESEWELYQSAPGDAESIVITNLEPRVRYGFRIASANSSGESAMSAEVTATAKNLRVRCRTQPAAAGTTGVKVALWMTPDVGGVVGAKIAERTGLAFEAMPVTDPDGKSVAIIYAEIDQVSDDVGELVDGDHVYGVASTATKSTWIMDDCVVQEA